MSKELDLKFLSKIVSLIATITLSHGLCAITENAKNDPYPVFTSLDPHTFLYTYEKTNLKDIPNDRTKQEWFSLSISPFGQNAHCGRALFGESCADSLTTATTDNTINPLIELGDLSGRWGMIGLLYGPLPECGVLPPVLVAARNCLFPDVPAGTPITDPVNIDLQQNFGFFSVPIDYRKRGIRFQFEAQLFHDWGMDLQVGIADIVQIPKFNDKTCNATVGCAATPITDTTSFNPNNPNMTPNNVRAVLMDNRIDISKQIGYSTAPFHGTSVEDIRAGIYWRHAYLMNEDRPSWPEFLLYPWATVEGSIATSKERDHSKAFALTFGNDGHNAVAFSSGINLDFTETIEIGMEAGYTLFFCRDFCNVRIPTSTCQSTIFPFATDARIQPGNNWNIGAKMFAYQFLGRLSFYFQYMLIIHKNDCITLKKHDPAFLPGLLEKRSTWQVQVANIGFNYDISPYISLGFFWQAPLQQSNAYQSSTILFSFNAVY